jgi:O-antigen biosynthesis protein
MLFTWERAMDKVFFGHKRFADHLERYNFAKKYCIDKIILDIASGAWYWTKILSDVAKNAYWVDVSLEAINFCKKNVLWKNISFTHWNWKKIPFDNDMFDVVISFETIEHIKNYEWFLKEIARVLKKWWKLLISTPNFKWEILKNKWHVSNFTTQTFVDAVSKYLDIDHIYYQGKHYYPFPGRGILETIFGIKRDIKIHKDKQWYDHHVTLIEATK